MLIAQLTDFHLRPPGRAANRVVETNMLAARALRTLAALRPAPDAILLTGDLADRGEPEAYALLARLLERAGVGPVFAIPGNHDDRAALRAALGTPQAGGFLQYTVEDFPVRLVLLDTLVPGASHGALCAERLGWLEATLAAAPDRPTLIAMHHPPFATGIGHMDRIALAAPEDFAAVLAHHPQVRLVVCGHVHRAITTRIGAAVVCIAPSVAHQVVLELGPEAVSAFTLEPPAFLLHHFSPTGGFVTHTALVEAYPGPFPFLGSDEAPAART
ncbi:MAG TPA: phosphodiesterase [Acetobacteraceae bacterium]|nr:phosphodiesterase [Acetobacteraceae bacterium]